MDGLGAILSDDAWKCLVSAGVRRRYAAGAPLMHQGDRADHVVALVGGRVKVTRVDEEGNELLLAIRGPGEVLGEIGVLGDERRSATVFAVERCDASVVAADRFLVIVRSFRLERHLLRHITGRLHEGEGVRSELAHLPARVRVARGLLRLAGVPAGPAAAAGPARGRPRPGPGTPLDVGLSQAELGRAVGLHRSSVAAELARLKRRGTVTTQRGQIAVVDIEALRAAARDVT